MGVFNVCTADVGGSSPSSLTTAKRLAQIGQRMMVKQLDRPCKFTLRGIRWQRANKVDCSRGTLHSRVYIMDKQAEHLRLQIEGGTRTPSNRVIAVPTNDVKLNRYGNLIGCQGRSKRFLNLKDTFRSTINGVAVIWQRPRRGRRSRGGSGTIGPLGPLGYKLLVAYQSRTHYQPRFDFYDIARCSVSKIVGREMDKAITKALQSAR